MIRRIAITPLPKEKRKFIADQRVKRLSTRARRKFLNALANVSDVDISSHTASDVHPSEFARAFSNFQADMALLSDEEQLKFQNALRWVLCGTLDSEHWKTIVMNLSALRRAAAKI